MRPARFVSAAAICSILLAACASHGSAVAPVARPDVVIPQVVQTGQQPTDWEEFPIPFGYTATDSSVIVGPDKQIWINLVEGQSIWRFDLTTSAFDRIYESGFTGTALTAGPDGNVWACGNELMKVVPSTLTVSTFAAPKCQNIAAGPDGNVWFSSGCSLIQVTTNGVLTPFETPGCLTNPEYLVTGPDKRIWYTEGGSIGAFDPSTFTYYGPYPTPLNKPNSGLAFGADGNLYSCHNTRLLQMTTSGVVRLFRLATPCDQVYGQGGSLIYFTTAPSYENSMATWGVYLEKETLLAGPPGVEEIQSDVLGPDANVYGTDGRSDSLDVYIQRILVVSPSSATLNAGQTQEFSISETGCTCKWTIANTDKGIVKLTRLSSSQFSVKALQGGYSTIVVADQKQNVFNVLITVQ
jgi:streptogramin lyase